MAMAIDFKCDPQDPRLRHLVALVEVGDQLANETVLIIHGGLNQQDREVAELSLPQIQNRLNQLCKAATELINTNISDNEVVWFSIRIVGEFIDLAGISPSSLKTPGLRITTALTGTASSLRRVFKIKRTGRTARVWFEVMPLFAGKMASRFWPSEPKQAD